MSKVIIVYAHPHKEGHNGLVLENVIKELEEKKQEYELLDLYEMKFDPVMKSDEHFLSKKKITDEMVLEMQKKISETNKLIIIFPVWWNNVPAVLKGFFDRVFSSGFAFKYKKLIFGLRTPIGLLKGKKAAVIYTTGSPSLIYWLIEGARAKKVVKLDTLRFCGIKSNSFTYGNAYKINDRARKKIPKIAKKAVKWVLK